MAGLAGMLAGFFLGGQFQYADGGGLPARFARQPGQRVERQLPSRGFGGKEEDFVQACTRASLEQGKQASHRFADAGRRLGHQAAILHGCLVYGFG